MQWYNEPRKWEQIDDLLVVTADPQSNIWRLTHSGQISDSAHFYYEEVTGDFVAEVKFGGDYFALYDQAGIMVREDERVWMKCGVEVVDGVPQASVVITRDFSDWSVVPLPYNPPAFWLRVARQGATVEVFYSLDDEDYTLLRQGYLTPTATLKVGLTCAAPRGEGFTTTFEGYRVRAL